MTSSRSEGGDGGQGLVEGEAGTLGLPKDHGCTWTFSRQGGAFP